MNNTLFVWRCMLRCTLKGVQHATRHVNACAQRCVQHMQHLQHMTEEP